MATDPRATLVSWFNPPSGSCKVTETNLTLDDNTTHAVFAAQYEMSETDLEQLFYPNGNNDLMFIIGKIAGAQSIGDPAIGYEHRLYVQAVCIEKRDADGVILDPAKMDWKATEEIRRVIRANRHAASFSLTGTETPDIQRLGSTLLYGPKIEVSFTQYIT